MLALRKLQQHFAGNLVSGDPGPMLALIEGGAISAAERLDIYRRNRDGTIATALKLTYPAVEALVGEAFFSAIAVEFSRHTPPTSALFSLYGSDFVGFLASHPQAKSLPYLSDVARLEWAAAQASSLPHDASSQSVFKLGELRLALVPSLSILRVDYPVLAIWRAVLDRDEVALSLIDPARAPATLAVWRQGGGAAAVQLSSTAAAFVDGLLIQGDINVALACAAEANRSDPNLFSTRLSTTHQTVDPIDAITAEVLQAGFVTLTLAQ